ncbi:MAG: AAA family ATPase [Planctomycetota bacterium]|nr:AAA family ATPase [Planctomycetota bacterium]
MTTAIERRTDVFRERFQRLRAEIGRVIVGHTEIVDGVITALFVGGHCLLEGVPGLGKTMLVRTLADCLELKFSRIQFTPDLMPADIIGTNMVMEDEKGNRHFQFQRGPIFCQVLLADEINRATPKTQSALLEAMQEASVTVGGTTNKLDDPFFVLATQNPIEMEGTYPLPEAQLDRFLFKLLVKPSNREELKTVLERTTGEKVEGGSPVMTQAEAAEGKALVREIAAAPHVMDYAVRLVLSTHPGSEFAPEITNKYVRFGSSPRGAQALIMTGKVRALLAGRYNVAFEDLEQVALPSLRHRLILNFEAEAEAIAPDTILKEILAKVPRTLEDDKKE